MNQNTPLVSVCLPIYNGAAFLEEALASLAAQTYPNLELIVSDDQSTDHSLQIVAAFQAKVGFPIRVFSHEPAGIGANWNHCVQHAQGEYIKFLFQDDVFYPECISLMVAQALRSPKIGMVYCKRDFLYEKTEENSNWIARYGVLHQRWDGFIVKDQEIVRGTQMLKDKKLLKFPTNKIGEPTAVLLHRRVFDKVGLFSPHLKQILDVEYWLRLMKHFDVVYIDQPLIYFRIHEQQASAINAKNRHELEDYYFYGLLIQNVFWQLHFEVQKGLFFNYTKFGNQLKKILKLNFLR
ncbi:hypothetical protein B0A58_04825 [Flavobacterium branchiophilum NBRC 15030 = ATCC 35035]|uniref:Glycosyltransferase involved in cell wall biosynthesis n=1 Tax=Flavobacterium branchiophilum TaxID=55197 RepID=A0A543G5D2_9FLAO|nr:glycosyltransferase [Flavobacterium branchiophilum]OXA78067.1 hypothetical protein B0A58_04825 [Flavobacterium branchiophilum NBRC 15030 = ATCC 35035]TQM41255.1 glycosyltransferase involved in cell wall biosynthesis [Flavobacterium branchiophilum]GEM54386.1 hypothetical protein FB1_06070 [Flavobacterium branchiophilum NBRC 15030 = ATCC 35035]